ncbi:MAG: hypothetical protein JW737_00810 [Acidobacteria bacterium]|nr:hypothetical protein [Acidobacteriota bacterium]
MILSYFNEAKRIFKRRLKVLFTGIKDYDGDDEIICHSILADCYNTEKNYFMVSSGHFSEFYARDFGWCAKSLVRLGYKEQVINTLDYALGVYKQFGSIESTIDPGGKPFTYPEKYSPDALAFIIRSIHRSRPNNLLDKYKNLLNWEIEKYYETVVDKDTGLVRRDADFGSMKDYSVRISSCYDNVMTGILADMLKRIRVLYNPFKKHNYTNLIIDNFWTGDYFLDDLSGDKTICGDSNVMPFWGRVVLDKKMIRKMIETVRSEGLDRPFPLKFTAKRLRSKKMIREEFFAGDYQRDAIWPHIGMMYIDVVRQVDDYLARFYMNQYQEIIMRYRNFLEVYTSSGKPFQNLWFYTDESMLWAANYLYLRGKIL